MTTHMPVSVRAETAGADLSSNQYYAVKFDGSGNVILAVANDGLGILVNGPANGARADMAVAGVVKAVAGAAIAKGAFVASDANGKIVTESAAGARVMGIALDAATADGEVIAIALSQGSI